MSKSLDLHWANHRLVDMGTAALTAFTARVYMGKKQAVGFYGWVNYRINDRGEWNRKTVFLRRFAEYANV